MTNGNTVQKTAYVSTAVQNGIMWLVCGAVSIFAVRLTKNPKYCWVMVIPIFGTMSFSSNRSDEKEKDYD